MSRKAVFDDDEDETMMEEVQQKGPDLKDVRAVLDQIDTDQEVVLPVFAFGSSKEQQQQPTKKVFDDDRDDEDVVTAEIVVKEAAQKNDARRKAEEEIRKIYSEKTEDDAPKAQVQESKKPILVIGSTGRTGAEIGLRSASTSLEHV